MWNSGGVASKAGNLFHKVIRDLGSVHLTTLSSLECGLYSPGPRWCCPHSQQQEGKRRQQEATMHTTYFSKPSLCPQATEDTFITH